MVEEGKIGISGEFEIWVGDKRIAKGKNMFTRYFLSSLVVTVARRAYDREERDVTLRRSMGYGATARVGTDTSTRTDPSFTDLVSKIDTAPSSVTRRLWRFEAEWKYIAEFLFKWNANVLPSGTIGEFGVWLYTDADDWDSPLTQLIIPRTEGDYYTHFRHPANRLVSRIASADGKFTEFYYDNTEPLLYIWRAVIQIK